MSTLPPLRRAVDRCGGIIVAALLLVLLATAPLRAAEDDPYSVTVSVDATGETSGKARDQARNDGERRALAMLAERLSGATAPAKLAKLDDNTLADLVVSFEVANERMSGVRYLADVTYHFRPAEVQRLLQKSGIALGGAGPAPDSGKSLVVVPVYQSGGASVLWDDPNPWRDAWAQQPSGTSPSAPHFAVPPHPSDGSPHCAPSWAQVFGTQHGAHVRTPPQLSETPPQSPGAHAVFGAHAFAPHT